MSRFPGGTLRQGYEAYPYEWDVLRCGFVGDGCLFAVSIFKGGVDLFAKQIVWSANRNNPVKAGALLQLTAANLSMVDGSGALVTGLVPHPQHTRQVWKI
ncbi:hypothetical protein CCACVL1_22431 [Corchorus capsularis]|uniref:Bulb-type lectin domain-containing protein n=1 Tax=Corchorus capsularis TaxID=210143 RepID=A0A1R3GYW8_COCAP|nr:hypothetical protein CCACVL1_22431 [Corchorus capsularis]